MSHPKSHNDVMLEQGTALLEKGHRIRIKESLDHSGNFKDPKNASELSAFVAKATKNNRKIAIYYDLRIIPGDLHQIACVDFDQGALWRWVSESLGTKQDGEFLMNPSKRGGHIVGYVSGTPPFHKKGIRVPLQCLAAADFLTDHVCLLGGEGRSITNLPSLENLGTLPPALLPHAKRKTPPVITDNGLPEGTRDNSMYRIAQNLRIPIEERAKVLEFTNRTFCNPPLEDEVIDKFVDQEPQGTDSEGGATSIKLSNKEVVVQLRNDREALEKGLDGKFRYHSVHRLWYRYTGTHWVGTSDERLLVVALAVVDDNIEEFLCKYTVEKRKALVKSLLGDLEEKLCFSEVTLSKRYFTSWRNGLLDFREQVLINHTPDVFVRHYIDQDYSSDEGLSKASQDFLVEITQGNPLYLMAIRLLFHNALSQNDSVQIITLFYGPHGVGKSVIANFLSSYFGNASLAVSMSNFSSAFAKHSVVQADLLVINELTGLTNKECQSLKSMVGHDHINMEVKYKQGVTSAPVKGLWVATSNQEPEDIAGTDVALRDRMLNIECSPRVGAGDSKLPQKLLENRSGWLNWSLHFHPEVLGLTVRAGIFNTLLDGYRDPLIIYISRCIRTDPQGFVSVRDLAHSYTEFFVKKGLGEPLTGTAIKFSIIKQLRSLYLLKVPEGRKIDPRTGSKLSCILGITLVEAGHGLSIGMPKNQHEGLFKKESLFDEETRTFTRETVLASPSTPPTPALMALPPGKGSFGIAESAETDPDVSQNPGSSSSPEQEMGTENSGLYTGRIFVANGKEIVVHPLPLASPKTEVPTKTKSVAVKGGKTIKSSQSKIKKKKIFIPMVWDEVMANQSPKFMGTEEHPPEYSVEYPLGRLGDKRLTASQRRKKGIPTTDEVVEAASGISLVPYPKSLVREAFDRGYTFFRDHMGTPLSRLRKPSLHEYSPHKPNHLASIMSERANLVRKTGVAANLVESFFQNSSDVWAVTLWRQRKEIATGNHQDDKNDAGRLFPYEYWFDVDGCHRYRGYPNHTVKDIKGSWKMEVFRTLNPLTKLNFFDIDMSACHARVILLVRDPKDRVFITLACENENTWLDLAKEFLNQHPLFAPLGVKVVRKCIKIYCLAQLNGAGLDSEHNLTRPLENVYCDNGRTGDSYAEALAKVLAHKSYVQECNGHGSWLCRKGYVYSLFKEGKVYPRQDRTLSKKSPPGAKGQHTLASIVLCNMETYMLSLVIEYLGTVSTKVVPLALMHDGMVVVTEEPTKARELQAVLDGFKPFSIKHLGFDLGLELTPFHD